jgi:peptidoglycan/LPS O-acetylase OafA/YrhL
VSLLNKLFPPPSAGTSRIIPSRHPVQVSLMIALIISSIFQFFQGPADISVWSQVSPETFLAILVSSVIGSVLCLCAAVAAERNPWNALGFSLGGFVILSVLMFFSTTLYMSLPGFVSITTFWTTALLTLGFMYRCAQLAVDAYRIWRHKEGRHE